MAQPRRNRKRAGAERRRKDAFQGADTQEDRGADFLPDPNLPKTQLSWVTPCSVLTWEQLPSPGAQTTVRCQVSLFGFRRPSQKGDQLERLQFFDDFGFNRSYLSRQSRQSPSTSGYFSFRGGYSRQQGICRVVDDYFDARQVQIKEGVVNHE